MKENATTHGFCNIISRLLQLFSRLEFYNEIRVAPKGVTCVLPDVIILVDPRQNKDVDI